MKKASALWGGTALLIELVILILALVRGDWMIPLLLAVFAGWSLWLIFTQLLPVWKNNRAYRKKEQELREQPVDGSNNLESDGTSIPAAVPARRPPQAQARGFDILAGLLSLPASVGPCISRVPTASIPAAEVSEIGRAHV